MDADRANADDEDQLAGSIMITIQLEKEDKTKVIETPPRLPVEYGKMGFHEETERRITCCLTAIDRIGSRWPIHWTDNGFIG